MKSAVLLSDADAPHDPVQIPLVDRVGEAADLFAHLVPGAEQGQLVRLLVGGRGGDRNRDFGTMRVRRVADLAQRRHLLGRDDVVGSHVQRIEAGPFIPRVGVPRPRRVGARVDGVHADHADRCPLGVIPTWARRASCQVFPGAGMRDPRRIEQPVGHEHPFAATIHRVVVGGGHDPDSHRLQIVDDRLGAARRRAVVVRVRLVDDRTFHVGVGRVRRAHHLGQGLKARIVQLTHRATDDDVARPPRR